MVNQVNPSKGETTKTEVATFGAGCFWCVEAVFKAVAGVTKVEPGYMGGVGSRPTYEAVCRGDSGYAEVCQVEYDANVVGFGRLLEVFFRVHDPTSLNRQGNDIGTQYKSVVFFHSDHQERTTRDVIDRLLKDGVYESAIVTEVAAAGEFWVAESEHHDYFAKNPENAYCQMVVRPKLDKFRAAFAGILRDRPD